MQQKSVPIGFVFVSIRVISWLMIYEQYRP